MKYTKRKRGDSDSGERPKKKRLITQTRARTEYKLSHADLANLPTAPLERPNPHYRSAAPMQLYVLSEVVARAKEKTAEAAAAKAYREEHAGEIEAAKRAAARAAKEAAAARLAAMHGGRARGEADGRRGDTPLPDVCYQRILCCLAEQAADPYGLVGPSLAARDIANASLACWDLYHASKHAFAALADYVERVPFKWVPRWDVDAIPARLTARQLRYMSPADLCERQRGLRLKLPGGLGWGEWDRVLGSPAGLTLEQLKSAAEVVGAKVTGTKAQLILWILEALGLAAPPCVPAKLLRACAAEPAVNIAYGGQSIDGGALLWLLEGASALCQLQRAAGEPATLAAGNLAGLRAALAARGLTTRAKFDAAVAAARAWLDARRREEAAARGQAPAAPAGLARACTCGKTAAQACPNGCCGTCCGLIDNHASCARHGFVRR